MALDVSDFRSNPNDQIAHAVRVIGRSSDRRKVFKAVYTGKRKFKTVEEIMRQTGLNRVRVDQEILKFVSNGIIRREKIDGEIVYGKDPFYAHNRDKILRFTQDKKKFEKFPTKINPKILAATIAIRLPRQMSKVKRISVDDIESFAQVRVQPHNLPVRPVREGWVKDGIRKLLGEQGDFRDWGGEQDDFGSSRLLMNGRRVTASFCIQRTRNEGKTYTCQDGKEW